MTRHAYLAAVLIAMLTSVAYPGVVTVSETGGGDFATIQKGVIAAASGDTVLVLPGTYSAYDAGSNQYPVWGRIYITKSLTLMSDAGPDETVITGHSESDHSILVDDSSPPHLVVIDGFTITQSPQSAVLLLRGAVGSAIRNCVVSENMYGITAVRTWTIEGCTVRDNSNDGIVATGCVVSGNLVTGNSPNIDLRPDVSRGGEAYDNVVVGGETGIICSNGNVIHHNLVEGCNYGIRIDTSGGGVYNNTVVGCTYGVTTNDQASLIGFFRNLVALNTYGLYRTYLYGTYNCNNVWGNDTDYFVAHPSGDDNFIDQDPMFCDPADHDYSLHWVSPCADDPTCGLIGALGPACGASAVARVSWGCLKGLYREARE